MRPRENTAQAPSANLFNIQPQSARLIQAVQMHPEVMNKAVLAQAALASEARAAESAAKKKRLIIGGSIVGVLLLVGGTVIYMKSKN